MERPARVLSCSSTGGVSTAAMSSIGMAGGKRADYEEWNYKSMGWKRNRQRDSSSGDPGSEGGMSCLCGLDIWSDGWGVLGLLVRYCGGKEPGLARVLSCGTRVDTMGHHTLPRFTAAALREPGTITGSSVPAPLLLRPMRSSSVSIRLPAASHLA